MKDLSDFQFFPGEDDDFEDKECLLFDARRKLDEEGRRSMEREEGEDDDANNVDDGAFNMLLSLALLKTADCVDEMCFREREKMRKFQNAFLRVSSH